MIDCIGVKHVFSQEKNLNELQKRLVHCDSEIPDIFHFTRGLAEVAVWGARYFLYLLQQRTIFSDNRKTYCIADIRDGIQLAAYYTQQLDSLLEILVRLGFIQIHQDGVYQNLMSENVTMEALFAEQNLLLNRHSLLLESHIKLLHSLLKNYLSILSGEGNFLSYLFPRGSFDIVINLYENNSESNY